jgi:hypothetical protein
MNTCWKVYLWCQLSALPSWNHTPWIRDNIRFISLIALIHWIKHPAYSGALFITTRRPSLRISLFTVIYLSSTDVCKVYVTLQFHIGSITALLATNIFILLGAVAKLRKATTSFVTSVCPSVSNSTPTIRIFMKFWGFFENMSRKLKFD